MFRSGSPNIERATTIQPGLQTEKTTLDELAKHRKRLQKEIREVKRGIADLEERLAEKGDYSLGEGDPSIYLWEMNLARRKRLQARLDELNAAMSRLEGGDYAVCSVCGGQIEPDRLELLLTTRMCSKCARSGR